MQRKLQQFIDALRAAGLRISTAETIEAARAVAVLGVERLALREGLGATLLADDADRECFEQVFDRFFAPPAAPNSKKKRRPSEASAGAGAGAGSSAGTGASAGSGARTGAAGSGGRPSVPPTRPATRRGESEPIPTNRQAGDPHRAHDARDRRRRFLRADRLRQPFDSGASATENEITELAEALARRFRHYARRRLERAHRGRLDMRRTLRRAVASGGVPVAIELRRPRPIRPAVIVLCDLSHSVAAVSEFLLALLAPLERSFRRVHRFGYVDTPVPISLEHGRLVPHEPIDLYARSDFGRVLVEFGRRYDRCLSRGTILLVLGDARNNRKPPHVQRLAALQRRVKRVVWLNPEERRRWDTGDSVMRLYGNECDVVLGARTPLELERALEAALRPGTGRPRTPRRRAGSQGWET